ncbi:hypothetical protein [Acinetobacter sp. MB5]|nr:hypothetical protein [Acinetobacter sp. MB5]
MMKHYLIPIHRDSSAGQVLEDKDGKKVWIPISPTQFVDVDS